MRIVWVIVIWRGLLRLQVFGPIDIDRMVLYNFPTRDYLRGEFRRLNTALSAKSESHVTSHLEDPMPPKPLAQQKQPTNSPKDGGACASFGAKAKEG